MTLVSRPVLGAVECVTPSAFCSGNASTAGVGIVCEGKTADYWINNPSWPPPYTPDTPFTDVFGPNDSYTCMTLQDVLTLPDSAPPAVDPAPAGLHSRHRDNLGSHGFDGQRGGGAEANGPPPERKSPRLTPSSLGPVANQAPLLQRRGSEAGASRLGSNDGALSGAGTHRQGRNRHNTLPVEPTEPASTPEPSAPAPLACNDNSSSPPPPSTPPSDPGSPITQDRRHRAAHNLGRASQPADRLARDVVASVLNAQAGFTPNVSVRTIRGIWREYSTKGYFEPTAGVQWGLQDIQTYIASTQPV